MFVWIEVAIGITPVLDEKIFPILFCIINNDFIPVKADARDNIKRILPFRDEGQEWREETSRLTARVRRQRRGEGGQEIRGWFKQGIRCLLTTL